MYRKFEDHKTGPSGVERQIRTSERAIAITREIFYIFPVVELFLLTYLEAIGVIMFKKFSNLLFMAY